jgi:hypothetical protein
MTLSTESVGNCTDKTIMLEKVFEIISLRKDLLEILSPYGVITSKDLFHKFNQHLGNDHPLYEDYLAAKQIESDLKDNIKDLQEILGNIIPK